MKTKTLWLIWLYLFAFCCIMGFIPDPPEFLKALLVTVGVAFFIPGALLLIKGDKKCRIRVLVISILSLVLTLVAVILNFTSVLMQPVWGTVFYIIMGIVSTPMLCCQIWIIGLFGWACLLSASIFTIIFGSIFREK
jgi:hypothetical protein